MNRTITLSANAKINLYLRIAGRRPDGYHELETVMQSVTLADTVTVSYDADARGKSISLTCTDPAIPCDGRNIAVKCAERFLDTFGINDCTVKIHIDKRIPAAGGLAGGSTDGAAVLRALNSLTGADASQTELCSIGAKVGADIPFCVAGGTALCTGIGDVLAPLDIPSPGYSVLIVSPGGGVSTPEAYAAIDRAGTIPAFPASGVTAALRDGTCPTSLHNDFESVILPLNGNAALVKRILAENGADAAMMSGSGPTVFGLFSDRGKCASAAAEVNGRGFRTYICRAAE